MHGEIKGKMREEEAGDEYIVPLKGDIQRDQRIFGVADVGVRLGRRGRATRSRAGGWSVYGGLVIVLWSTKKDRHSFFRNAWGKRGLGRSKQRVLGIGTREIRRSS